MTVWPRVRGPTRREALKNRTESEPWAESERISTDINIWADLSSLGPAGCVCACVCKLDGVGVEAAGEIGARKWEGRDSRLGRQRVWKSSRLWSLNGAELAPALSDLNRCLSGLNADICVT